MLEQNAVQSKGISGCQVETGMQKKEQGVPAGTGERSRTYRLIGTELQIAAERCKNYGDSSLSRDILRALKKIDELLICLMGAADEKEILDFNTYHNLKEQYHSYARFIESRKLKNRIKKFFNKIKEAVCATHFSPNTSTITLETQMEGSRPEKDSVSHGRKGLLEEAIHAENPMEHLSKR